MLLRPPLFRMPAVWLALCGALLLGSPTLRAEPVARPGSAAPGVADQGAVAEATGLAEVAEVAEPAEPFESAAWSGRHEAAEGADAIEALHALDAPEPADEGDSPAAAARPAGRTGPVHQAVSGLLRQQAEQDRRAQLAQTYLHRPPTWIQDAATVNLGDFPSLHDPTADTERSMQTLEWVLREQARQAASRRATGENEPDATPATGWRLLLPGHWLPVLKANRDLVLSGGAGLLLLAWAVSAWPRRRRGTRRRKARPGAADPAAAPPRRRRRRRIRLGDITALAHGERSDHGHGGRQDAHGQPSRHRRRSHHVHHGHPEAARAGRH